MTSGETKAPAAAGEGDARPGHPPSDQAPSDQAPSGQAHPGQARPGQSSSDQTSSDQTCPICADRISRLERRLARERAARAAAEETAERGLRQIYERQMDAELLGKVAGRANDIQDVDAVMAFALEGVLERTGWAFGSVHFLAPNGKSLQPARATRGVDDSVAPLRRFARENGFGIGDDMVHAAITGRAPAVAARIAESAMTFSRRLAAIQCGMRSAVVVPVLSGERVLAVMEFMSPVEGAPREGLPEVLMQVAAQTARAQERDELARRLEHDALHDPLTSLPNRQLFSDRLERAVRAHLRNGAGYAVLFVDLDRFKTVNDRLGHAVGDAVLLEVAGMLRQLADSHPGAIQATVARMGGDEFCLLIEDQAAAVVAEELSRGILHAATQPMELHGHSVQIGACIGIAIGDASYSQGDAIIRDADAAMYEAKASGRSQVKVYSELFRDRDRRRDELLQELAAAEESGFSEFTIVYQPIVSLPHGALKGFEALTRWTRASGEVVPPPEFIALAEENNLIRPLGDWIIDTALAALVDFQQAREAGGEARDLIISINVSPKQLLPAFVDFVTMALARHGVAAGQVSLEITERVALNDDSATAEAIRRLRELGLSLSIDDFGTGYSTFSYLQKFPFETLKIDRSFVSAISDDQGGLDIVRAIVEMARSLGVAIVAEGTETREHVEALARIGCDQAQGYYFSRPVDRQAALGLASGGPLKDQVVA